MTALQGFILGVLLGAGIVVGLVSLALKRVTLL